MHLIGLAGPARSGKSTIAEHLSRSHGFDPVTFATPLKRALLDMLEPLGFTAEHLENAALKETVFEPLGTSPRYLMQTLGTEWGRELVHPELWLRLARARIERLAQHGSIAVVVTDVRFPNEAELVRSLGGRVWHVYRPDALRPHIARHVSEDPVPFARGDLRLANDGTIDELHAAADRLVCALDPADVEA